MTASSFVHRCTTYSQSARGCERELLRAEAVRDTDAPVSGVDTAPPFGPRPRTHFSPKARPELRGPRGAHRVETADAYLEGADRIVGGRLHPACDDEAGSAGSSRHKGKATKAAGLSVLCKRRCRLEFMPPSALTW